MVNGVRFAPGVTELHANGRCTNLGAACKIHRSVRANAAIYASIDMVLVSKEPAWMGDSACQMASVSH